MFSIFYSPSFSCICSSYFSILLLLLTRVSTTWIYKKYIDFSFLFLWFEIRAYHINTICVSNTRSCICVYIYTLYIDIQIHIVYSLNVDNIFLLSYCHVVVVLDVRRIKSLFIYHNFMIKFILSFNNLFYCHYYKSTIK